MSPRLLKRLEDLLRRANDKASSPNERELAVSEALRIVQTTRESLPKDDGPWGRVVLMRFQECAVCFEKISPASVAYQRGMSYAHAQCVQD